MKRLLPLALLAVFVTAVIVLLMPSYSYNDPDTFWHIELGRYMIQHQTVLHHAIHTFYQDQLPYVPHEYAFQIVLAGLFNAFGWPGTYLLTAACLLALIVGMQQLTRISRKEIGMPQTHPLLLLVVLAVASWVYYNYFTTRPQMMSAALIVWFVVVLRHYQLRPGLKPAIGMSALSLAVANVHAGVWLVVAVFTMMAMLELLWERRWSWRRAAAFAPVLLAGLLNPGGLKSVLFILTVTKNDYNMLIDEWQPIPFSKLLYMPMTLLLLAFAAMLPFVLHRKAFRFMLMLGVLFLGVSSFKMNLFLWLFFPYFAATLPEQIPLLRRAGHSLQARWSALQAQRVVLAALVLGLLINVAWIFARPPQVDAQRYPVEEMNYIMEQVNEDPAFRPKVMAPYGASGYVMFRGGNILCDGRQDPFITEHSTGALGWNAFQRSMYGYGEYLPEVVKEDRPDYVIARNNVSGKLLREWTELFGQPVYQGSFGHVFAISASLPYFE